MFFDNNTKIKIGLGISNVIFIVLSGFLYFSNEKLCQKDENLIYVDIAGEVNNPGLYQIDSDKPLDELIKMAGGLTDNADLNAINRADSLSAGKKVKIPSKNSGSNNQNQNGKININTASQTELEKLYGIGSVKAKAIIAYRESKGPFTDIVQILKVDGIGDKTYEKIKDDICV